MKGKLLYRVVREVSVEQALSARCLCLYNTFISVQTWNINAKYFWQLYRSVTLLLPANSDMLYNTWQAEAYLAPSVCIFQQRCRVWQHAKGYRFQRWDLEDLYLSPQRQIYLIWQLNPLRDALTVIKERTSVSKVSLWFGLCLML